MDNYVATLDKVGEAILAWADPENKYRGYTEVWLPLRIVVGLSYEL